MSNQIITVVVSVCVRAYFEWRLQLPSVGVPSLKIHLQVSVVVHCVVSWYQAIRHPNISYHQKLVRAKHIKLPGLCDTRLLTKAAY